MKKISFIFIKTVAFVKLGLCRLETDLNIMSINQNVIDYGKNLFLSNKVFAILIQKMGQMN